MPETIRADIDEIRLHNFRAFSKARLGLSDLTYLVGRNGAGKSSILDAVNLLREAVSDSLENALDRRGGFGKIRRLGVEDPLTASVGLALVLNLTLPGERRVRALYGFELRPHDGELLDSVHEQLACTSGSSFIRQDTLFEAQPRDRDVVPPRRSLVLPLVAGADPIWQAVLEVLRNLRAYEFSPAHIASASDIGETTTLQSSGANASDVLKALQSGPEHGWLVRHLAAITEGITDIRAEALLGRRVLRFVQNTGEKQQELDARQVSQGTLRSLGVLLALRQRPIPSLVLVDEIENSVHPSALAVLLDAALASCDRTRVVLTTHSPEVLSHPSVTGERVRVLEWKEGISRIFRLTPETEAAIDEIDTVGWMLRSNALWTGPEPQEFSGLFQLSEDEP